MIALHLDFTCLNISTDIPYYTAISVNNIDIFLESSYAYMCWQFSQNSSKYKFTFFLFSTWFMWDIYASKYAENYWKRKLIIEIFLKYAIFWLNGRNKIKPLNYFMGNLITIYCLQWPNINLNDIRSMIDNKKDKISNFIDHFK